jgi:hypothetical protein
MKIYEILLKAPLKMRWFPAGLACLLATATVGHAQAPIEINFNSSADVSGWANAWGSTTITSQYIADAPAGGPSAGSLLFTATYGPSSTWGVIDMYFSSALNLTGYTNLSFYYKVTGAQDTYGTSGSFVPYLFMTGTTAPDDSWNGGYLTSPVGTWVQANIPLADYVSSGGNIADVTGIALSLWDGYYTSNATLSVEFTDFAFTGGSGGGGGSTNGDVTPQFSNLSNQTIHYGAADAVLTGTVGTSTNSLPNGSAVSATVDGITQSGAVYDTSGDFSISYDAVGIPISATPYPVTYTSAIESGFFAATNTGTTMTVNQLPVVLSGVELYSATNTTTVPASDLSVANLVGGDNLTLSGSVTIANTNFGAETITSFSGLTLGGTAATNYTLTGATGTVTIGSLNSAHTIIPRSFFGLHGLAYPANSVPVPYQPWGLIRSWDHWGNGDITWAGLEPSNGTFTWSTLDAAVNAVTNQNAAYLYCFGNGPSWVGGTAPTNIAAWDTFITNFVTRYHTRIKYLETWNEAAAGEGFYTGTTAMLVQMEHDLYTITKSIDPTVTVLTPDATGGQSVVGNFFNGYFAAGGTNCDAVAFHGYCSEAFVTNQICYPEEIIGIVGNLKTAMNSYGQGSKPIYCTEGDWGSEGTGANQPTTNDAVAFMARHYLLMWSLGVSSYAWYAWDFNGASWQDGQLWTYSTGPLNAAGIAYQQLYYWMVGATMSQPYTNQGSVYTCGFTRPGGYQALAVWNTNRASTSTFTVPNGYVQYRDLGGNLYSISNSSVTIGIEPILLENMNEPTFSGLSSDTITYGAASMTLTGTVSSYGTYPPKGTAVTVTINGNAQGTTTSDTNGDFSINYSTTGLPASATPYPVTYSCAAGGSFPGGTDTTTTLTVNQLLVVLGGVSVSPDGTRFIFNYPTVLGQSYQLEYSTNLASGTWLPMGSPVAGTGAPVSVTNSISSSTQMFFILSITP